MRTVCEKDKCTGCMVCRDVCPQNAITIEDSFRAYNAIIDDKKCINCNECLHVCQIDHTCLLQTPMEWYQGWARDSAIRARASSGGLATAIEKAFVENGGSVCSCVFQEGEFCFSFAENAEDVIKFSGSKYIKSNPSGCYIEVKKRLVDGKKILFVGLPCQIGAMKNYVGENLCNNLYTIDLICHGSPNPKILNTFLKQYKIDLARIKEISFRVKNSFALREKSEFIGSEGVLDKYSIAFLNALFYTENCYECQYAKMERASDITLGDSWGSDLSKDEQKKGISLVLCQNQKGLDLLNCADLELMGVNIEKAIDSNHQLRCPSKKPKRREYFLKQIEKGKKFNHIICLCCPKSSFKQIVKGCLIKMILRRN